MKVLILGASGIVGSTMRLCVPDGIDPVWVRRHADPITRGCDITDSIALDELLAATDPDVIVNLAGESNVDIVERAPERYASVNSAIPGVLAMWCERNSARMLQISTQAVHRGDDAPYAADGPADPLDAVNAYGAQKAIAEQMCGYLGATIIRLTFVLGIRPLPHVGRQNPLEAMFEHQSPQVNNRWFSPLMAWDAALLLWKEIVEPCGERVIQFGIQHPWSRYQIAALINPDVNFCRHEDFAGLAPRPFNVSYIGSRVIETNLAKGIEHAKLRASDDRAIEIALFLGVQLAGALMKVGRGFGSLHAAVTEDFKRAKPIEPCELLDWYRRTESYIWELSAYHDDPGFNYSGMCRGIVEHLQTAGAKRVLCLGDGIGDLTLAMMRAGMKPVYHDLAGSRTADYAMFRIWRQTGSYPAYHMSQDWAPPAFVAPYDAVVSLDFLEHVTDVEAWVRAVCDALKPGGLFCAQNAFAIGSGPEGSMPMHLSVNDKYEKDWDPLLTAVGFEQLSSNWYRKAL